MAKHSGYWPLMLMSATNQHEIKIDNYGDHKCSNWFLLLENIAINSSIIDIIRCPKLLIGCSFWCWLLPAATKLGQGNVFTGVCDSVHGGGGCIQACLASGFQGGVYPSMHCRWYPSMPCNKSTGVCVFQYALQMVSQHALQQVYRGVCIPACLAAGLQGGGVSRPTPKGEVEGGQIQAHTQGGNWGGSDPGPHPRGKFEGDQIQAAGTHPTGMHSCI